MNKNLTELVLILDRSGSMCGLEQDTIGGFNSMLEKQRKEPGEVLVSTLLFDDQCEVIHDRVPLDRVPPLDGKTYYVRGMTALLDAMGGAIHHIGNVHKYAREEDRPGKTLFVVITDGMENASRRYSLRKVKQQVERQQKKYGWEFLFLGANMDAISAAGHLGIQADRAVRFQCDSVGSRLNYDTVSDAVSALRCGAPLTEDWKAPIEADFARRGGK